MNYFKRFVMFNFLTLTLLLTGCSKAPDADDVVGIYSSGSEQFIFKPNGKGTYRMSEDMIENIDWHLEGDSLLIKTKYLETLSFVFEGDSITFPNTGEKYAKVDAAN